MMVEFHTICRTRAAINPVIACCVLKYRAEQNMGIKFMVFGGTIGVKASIGTSLYFSISRLNVQSRHTEEMCKAYFAYFSYNYGITWTPI